MVLRSSEPVFGVRTDGSIFAAEEANLDEPVQFKVTAEGPRARVWETVVQLALIDPPPAPQKENEVSCITHTRTRTHTDIRPSLSSCSPDSGFFQVWNEVKTSRGGFRRHGCAWLRVIDPCCHRGWRDPPVPAPLQP